MPWRSKVAVFRFALRRSLGSGKSLTARVAGSTRAIAFCPPSVTQAAPRAVELTRRGGAAQRGSARLAPFARGPPAALPRGRFVAAPRVEEGGSYLLLPQPTQLGRCYRRPPCGE